MKTRIPLILLPLIAVSLLFSGGVCYGQDGQKQIDTLAHVVLHFRPDRAVVDSGYKSNNAVLKELDRIIGNKSIVSAMDSLDITTSISPVGQPDECQSLGERRAKAVRIYLIWKYPQINRRVIAVNYRMEDPDDIKGTGATSVALLKTQAPPKEAITPPVVSPPPTPAVVAKEETPEPFITQDITPLEDPAPASLINTMKAAEAIVQQPEVTPAASAPKSVLGIKVNMAAYALVVANLGIEVPLSAHLSVDLPFYYSPYTISEHFKCRILMTQPELRYWLKQPMGSHYLGAYLMGGWYNIGLGYRNRLQDANGDSPFYGGGFSYGYALPFNRHWSIEFTLGLGYLYLNNDKFYNVTNGARFESKRTHYWGPTKWGFNLIYRFSK